MNRKTAKTLVSELAKHSRIVTPDNELFLDVLTSADIKKSSKFYESLPDKQQLVKESNLYHYLSLRRILRNRNAMGCQLSAWKKAYETIASTIGIYSSDILNKNLRTNDTLVEMMTKCEEPFSLLGKLQTYNFDNPDNTLFIVTRPILIIPNAKNMEPIYDWEDKNTTYEKEIRTTGLLSIRKRIKPQEYFSQ